ncbi:DUF3043 domain-containing protein [Corynebacterium sanguinis]|uniref:DUF3043 domain-containing protein n=1 Tax=Corynebacterium sanguinis TaxID=2594913 RepID=UPI001186A277|nr:DUF3043 domain-containing protein [Corynebacterium sanguinis]MCT1424904.1 DUF3043 domain-containing protein [Corynebacterium sanguinis]MCT1443763.1 DUF3043 domain-containing protein [Corynebacterium sanguinis]MCT1491406.1 DUF3043 domain-containing protein [Corynebacterium sanguinis]MCT1596334.1 DUF3043 domain-containing protein [Corynebacterium sanguinis]MCT1694325.1 DUF3043 domain-containing protein [Corynebacterium sanguinis]
MKLPWQKTENTKAAAGSTKIELPQSTAGPSEPVDAATTREEKKLPKGYTPPKGRPTPKRIEQEVKRGVVRDPNALTPAQQNQRNKELRKSMSKEEWKAYKKKQRDERRASNREMQARMDQGDERYLMDRDKGEVRRYVRDWIDSRYFINNWVMPIALVILVLTFLVSFASPQVANIITFISMAFMLTIIAEGFIIGRSANKAVRAKFPDTDETGFPLGMYAFSRATQPRKWRTPKPQVAAGSKVQ